MQRADFASRVVERHLRLLTQLLSFLSGHLTGVPLVTVPGFPGQPVATAEPAAGGAESDGGAGKKSTRRRRSSNGKAAKKRFMSAVELVEQARRLEVPVSRVGGGWGVEYR